MIWTMEMTFNSRLLDPILQLGEVEEMQFRTFMQMWVESRGCVICSQVSCSGGGEGGGKGEGGYVMLL